jgi:hypothetical protein
MARVFALAALSAAAALQDTDHRFLVGPFSHDPLTDCAMRNLTYEYALALLPARAPLVTVFDALRLSIDCNVTRPVGVPRPVAPFYAVPSGGVREADSFVVLRTLPLPSDESGLGSWYVDAAHGSDANACTITSPCATIAHALALSRAAGGGGSIVLRGSAPFVLTSPVVLGAGDSGLSISAYPGEAPLISGGVPLDDISWTRIGPSPDPTANATVWTASLATAGAALPFNSLFLAGARAIRARFPNANPETDIVPTGYTRATAWLPPQNPRTVLVQANPLLGTLPRRVCPPDACTQGGPQGSGPPWAIFCCFFWGSNGTVENFTTGSFWGVHPGPPGGPTYRTPGGLVAGPDLQPRLHTWVDAADAPLVHAFHGSYWGDWAFSVSGIDAANGTVTFGTGGWQEARGASAGDYFYVENVSERPGGVLRRVD